jgi:hypothetical protein
MEYFRHIIRRSQHRDCIVTDPLQAGRQACAKLVTSVARHPP